MKVAPLFHALHESGWANPQLVHTGQHYDANMSDVFFRELRLPEPTYHLGIGSGSHAEQTGRVMMAYEQVCQSERPDWIVVVGDVNSTAACAMVGTKLWIPVVHLEAGLRSRDRRMPEEINRLVTDAIADVLWTPSADADANLLAEGVPTEKIDRIGNIMIDSFEMLRNQIESQTTRADLGVNDKPYTIVTLHRPSNVDTRESLSPIVQTLIELSEDLIVIFVAHPRTMKALDRFDLSPAIADAKRLVLLEPLPYTRFMNLVIGASCVLTDSGGLQEETTYLGIPCLTLRENTERPITVEMGTNKLVSAGNLAENLRAVLDGHWPNGNCPPLWDGGTAVRAAACLKRRTLG